MRHLRCTWLLRYQLPCAGTQSRQLCYISRIRWKNQADALYRRCECVFTFHACFYFPGEATLLCFTGRSSCLKQDCPPPSGEVTLLCGSDCRREVGDVVKGERSDPGGTIHQKFDQNLQYLFLFFIFGKQLQRRKSLVGPGDCVGVLILGIHINSPVGQN